jgi:hypothetical protein
MKRVCEFHSAIFLDKVDITLLKRNVEELQNENVLLKADLSRKNIGLCRLLFNTFLEVINKATEVEFLTRDKVLLEINLDNLKKMYNAASEEILVLKEKLVGVRKALIDEL